MPKKPINSSKMNSSDNIHNRKVIFNNDRSKDKNKGSGTNHNNINRSAKTRAVRSTDEN